MDGLPRELGDFIMSHLTMQDLSRVARCSRLYWEICNPLLYRTLSVRLRPHGPCKSSRGMMRSLLQNSATFCLHLRHIHVTGQLLVPSAVIDSVAIIIELILQALKSNPGSCLRSFLWELPVKIRLRIVQSLPKNIQRLALEGPLIDETIMFPQLTELQCTSYFTVEQNQWLKSHITIDRLRKLSLGAKAPGHVGDPCPVSLMPGIPTWNWSDSSLLTQLNLDSINLEKWPFYRLPNLVELKLVRCLHVGEALTTFCIWNKEPRSLKRLQMTIAIGDLDLEKFIGWLGEHASLEELSLLISDCREAFSLGPVMKHRRSLTHLILESRMVAAVPCTVFSYNFEQFQELLLTCPKLVHLAMPLQITDVSRLSSVSHELLLKPYKATPTN